MSRDRLPEKRERIRQRLRHNADLLYRHTGTFTLGPHRWSCRFSVRDQAKVTSDELASLQAFAAFRGLIYTDLRLLKVHPDDDLPFPGATLPWDDGTLEVLDWAQASDFTGLRVGTCVLRRP